MPRTILTPLVGVLAGALLTQCASTDNSRLEERLDRREERMDGTLERMDMRSDSRSSRWQKMAEWEDARQARNWNRMMQ